MLKPPSVNKKPDDLGMMITGTSQKNKAPAFTEKAASEQEGLADFEQRLL